MTTPSLATIKAQLSDLPGIDALGMEILLGRHNYQLGGKVVSVDPNASAADIEIAIRSAISTPGTGQIAMPPASSSASLLPSVSLQSKQENNSMTTTPAPGSFAAELKSILDEARAGLDQARANGRARVRQAVGKLANASVAVERVSETTAKSIEDQADNILSDLGQISNDL